jgi:DNA segregation ATPase FtsK/SpoIIIE-like protein
MVGLVLLLALDQAEAAGGGEARDRIAGWREDRAAAERAAAYAGNSPALAARRALVRAGAGAGSAGSSSPSSSSSSGSSWTRGGARRRAAPYEMPALDLLAEPRQPAPSATVSTDALEQNATLLGRHRAGDVVGERDDAARLGAGRRLQLVERHHRTGIELPNAKRETVYLRELLASPVFAETKQKLALCPSASEMTRLDLVPGAGSSS